MKDNALDEIKANLNKLKEKFQQFGSEMKDYTSQNKGAIVYSALFTAIIAGSVLYGRK